MIYLWIALGSAIGGVGRYWCSGFIAHHVGETFPWGTLFVNVAGSLLIGLFATLLGSSLVTLEKVRVRRYGGGTGKTV